ncbi:MAG: IS5 family transposase [Deinococcales bacterium]
METTYPSELTEEQWNHIKGLIPQRKSRGGPRTLDMKAVVNGIMYIVVGGGQWRMLPKDYPNWKSVYHYFRIWRDNGVWKDIHDRLRVLVRQKAGKHKHATGGCLDSQSVKASEYSGIRGFDAGKKVNGKKRHILVDTMGLILALLITSASVQDRDGARTLLSRLEGFCKKMRVIWVDGGYRGELIEWVGAKFRFCLRVVLRSEGSKGFEVLPYRWIVERTLAWLGKNRRLSKDYERLNSSSEAMVHIAMIRLMLRRLA